VPFSTITIGLDPVAFSLGPVAVHWYGLAYVAAIAFGLWVILRECGHFGLSRDQVWTVATWAVPAGFVGGRLYYLVQNRTEFYLTHPLQAIAVWNGGMAFFGAIFAVPVAVVAVGLVKRWPLLPMLDIAALFALVAQPIGRLGNVVNGDILGPPTHLPWGFVYSNANSFAPSTTTAYHPAAAYEIVANLLLIAVLFPLRHRFPRGGLLAAYVAGYCLTQLLVFQWRSQPVVAFGLRQAQVTALVVLGVEALVLGAVVVMRRWPGARPRMLGNPM
jgi:phosphatidylglycerol:prolipoprotein diacylglycerol transferase